MERVDGKGDRRRQLWNNHHLESEEDTRKDTHAIDHLLFALRHKVLTMPVKNDGLDLFLLNPFFMKDDE